MPKFKVRLPVNFAGKQEMIESAAFYRIGSIPGVIYCKIRLRGVKMDISYIGPDNFCIFIYAGEKNVALRFHEGSIYYMDGIWAIWIVENGAIVPKHDDLPPHDAEFLRWCVRFVEDSDCPCWQFVNSMGVYMHSRPVTARAVEK